MSVPVAAFGASINVTGASTTDSNEACSFVSGTGANQLYQVTSTAKRVWDPTVAITVKDGGTTLPGTDYKWNPLGGTVQFTGYTPGGAITVSGNYFPLYQAALCNSFDMTGKNTLVDVSNFDGSGAVERYPTLCDVEGNLHVLEDFLTVLDSGSLTWKSIFYTQTPVVIIINMGSTGSPLYAKFFAILESEKLMAKVADVLQGDLGFKGAELGGAFNSYFGP